MKMKKIAAVVLAALMMLGATALAQGSITVQGYGSVRVDSNRASINLGVREIADEVMTAQTRVNEKINAVVDALKAMGVTEDEISTNGIGIYPNYNYDEGETISGYTAYNNIYFTVTDVNNTGAYIDAAFEAGANSLDYVEFSATDTEAAAAKALTLAVASAKDKAQVVADAAGVKLGGILEIRDSADTGYDGQSLFARNAEGDKGGAGTSVMASKQTVSAIVSITFALEDAD